MIYVLDYELRPGGEIETGPGVERLAASFRASTAATARQRLVPRGQSQTPEAKRKRALTAEAIVLGYEGPRERITVALVQRLREKRRAA